MFCTVRWKAFFQFIFKEMIRIDFLCEMIKYMTSLFWQCLTIYIIKNIILGCFNFCKSSQWKEKRMVFMNNYSE